MFQKQRFSGIGILRLYDADTFLQMGNCRFLFVQVFLRLYDNKINCLTYILLVSSSKFKVPCLRNRYFGGKNSKPLRWTEKERESTNISFTILYSSVKNVDVRSSS